MNRATLTILALVPLVTGCPGMICNCDKYNDFAMPEGEFGIEEADDEFIAAGTATFTEDTLTFNYTDPDGNEWEIAYAVTEE